MNGYPDNIERVGPDMGQIPRDTYEEVLEFRVRLKSNAHVGVDFFKSVFKADLQTNLFDIIFIKENKHLNREE